MNNTQNQKIAQVTDKTLIVGVDIGGETHYARAILVRGYEISKKPYRFENTEEGLSGFIAWVNDLSTNNNLNKIMIGVEPTGHYWFNFAEYLKRCKHQTIWR